MVKIPGGTAGSIKRLKKEMERSAGGSAWIRGVKAGEDMTVRFLTEPDDWYSYREHYDDTAKFFACIGKDNDCPGCHADSEKVQRTSRRFLANALDVDTGRVIPLKLPLDLANRLVARYERNGDTIVDRDYILHRMGSGLETTYDVTPRDPSPMDTSRYDLVDLEKALIDQFDEAFGVDDDDDDDDEVAERVERITGNRKVSRNEPEEDDDTDVEVPSEPSASAEEDDEDGEYLSEAEALKMSRKDLMALAQQYDVEYKTNWTKQQLVDAIFEAAA